MISGKIVKIKGISKQDAPLIYEWVNKENLRDLTGTLYPISEYEHENWIENVTLNRNQKLFAVYHKNKCIGTIGLKNIDQINSNAELYISLGENVPGGGADAVNTLVNFCFMHLNLHKIYLYVFESNLRAINCYKKAGFTIEGKLLEHHFAKGKYENVLIMGKVSSL